MLRPDFILLTDFDAAEMQGTELVPDPLGMGIIKTGMNDDEQVKIRLKSLKSIHMLLQLLLPELRLEFVGGMGLLQVTLHGRL